jgi:hypothetical protein
MINQDMKLTVYQVSLLCKSRSQRWSTRTWSSPCIRSVYSVWGAAKDDQPGHEAHHVSGQFTLYEEQPKMINQDMKNFIPNRGRGKKAPDPQHCWHDWSIVIFKPKFTLNFE